MKSLGLQASQQELQQMMTEADEDGSGSIGHHLLQLVLRGLQSQGPHHGGQLLDGQDIDY